MNRWPYVILIASLVVLHGCTVVSYDADSDGHPEAWYGALATDRGIEALSIEKRGSDVDVKVGKSESKQEASEFVESMGGAAGATIGELIDRAKGLP